MKTPAKKKYRIWFQGATDRVHMAPYIRKVEAHLKRILDPGFSYTFNTIGIFIIASIARAV